VNTECICPCDHAVCPTCGRRWDVYSVWTTRDGVTFRTYGSFQERDRYRALYGAHPANMYIPIEAG
jgi:hypothetical protein